MDRSKREYERGAATADPEAQARLLREKMRSNEITRGKVSFAAFLGDESARQIIPEEDYITQLEEVPVGENQIHDIFEFVERSFGEKAAVSMLIELFDQFKHLSSLECYDVPISSIPSINNALKVLRSFVSGESVTSDDLRKQEDILHSQFGLYDFDDDALADLQPKDIHYAFSPVEGLASIFTSLVSDEGSVLADAYAYLINPYIVFTKPPSHEIMGAIPEHLRNTINSIQSKEILRSWDDLEHEKLVNEVFFSIMKQGGLKWALKDVK